MVDATSQEPQMLAKASRSAHRLSLTKQGLSAGRKFNKPRHITTVRDIKKFKLQNGKVKYSILLIGFRVGLYLAGILGNLCDHTLRCSWR